MAEEPQPALPAPSPPNPDNLVDEEIAMEDNVPAITEQARVSGWKADYYNFGKLEDQGVDYFNPGIIEREDGLWMLTRTSEPHRRGLSFGQNHVTAFKLDDTGKIPKMGVRLRWPVDNPDQHFEDPRGFYHQGLNQTLIGACTFTWDMVGWSGAHQVFGAFDQDWQCKKMDYPKIGGNPGQMQKIEDRKDYEKNWVWFLNDNKLNLLYKADPWLIIAFGDRWSERTDYKSKSVTWGYGQIRGGTTPVKIGDLYFTFHHSSLPWKGRYRRYYAGAVAFEANPPFAPKLITPEPILIGSQNNVWAQHKPLVVFPCGSVFKDGNWLVTCGINDLKSAWLELSHKSLLDRMRPIDEVGGLIFSVNGAVPSAIKTSAEITLEKRRAALVKARAARALRREQMNKFVKEYGETEARRTLYDPPKVTTRKRRRKKKLAKS